MAQPPQSAEAKQALLVLGRASEVLKRAASLPVVGSSLLSMTVDHPGVLGELVKGKKAEGSENACWYAFAKAQKHVLELDALMTVAFPALAAAAPIAGAEQCSAIVPYKVKKETAAEPAPQAMFSVSIYMYYFSLVCESESRFSGLL